MAAHAEHMIIVADGAVDAGLLAHIAAKDGHGRRARLIAADGGAAKVLRSGLVPDLVIGDGDSLASADRARLEAFGVELRMADPDKDESDTELCLLAALADGARHVSIVGAFGEARPEHTVANLLMLADSRLDDVRVEILTPAARLTRIGSAGRAGAIDIGGQPGDYVSLFPLGEAVHGVTTEGLRFPLQDATLELGRSRGLSNEIIDRHARVSTALGCLLVVHTAVEPAGPPAKDEGG